ncbi:MAG: hypothetical protein LBR88_00925 [Zoogloeaceae bacterium]|nr:hypothetical protein [Zoogloeaceae bacterium]
MRKILLKAGIFMDNSSTMNEILKNMLQGARENFSLLDRSPYHLPASGNGFAEDLRTLRGDSAKLAEDMTSVIKKHEQNNQRSR